MPETTREMDLKGFGPFEIKDEDRGEVTAIVATLGVVDKDGDVILPGAIEPGNKVKLSSYGHDVVLNDAAPVGIGSITEEGDKAIFKGRFFTATERGREAFLTVKELGADGEWSFGFPRKGIQSGEMTDEWRAQGARRIIAKLTPVEASPVFQGAGWGTGTLSVKSELKADSLSDRLEAVHNALWARNDSLTTPEPEDSDRWYAHEVFDEYVIARAGARMLRVAYTIEEDGSVTLGEAVEVEVEYRPVAEKAASGEEVNTGQEEETVEAASFAETEPETKSAEEIAAEAAAAEAELEAARITAEEDELKAKAAEEFDRFQRTARRLGLAA